MARPLRLQFDGAVYLLIVRGISDKGIFRDNADRKKYLEILARYKKQLGVKIYAYVLLNRYLELLMETPKGNISRMMQCLGTSYTSYFNRRYGRKGTLFEGRYKSYLIDKENYLALVTAYIHTEYSQNHPASKNEFPWSSYPVYLGKKESELIDPMPVLGRFGPGAEEQHRNYREFVEKNQGARNVIFQNVSSRQVVGPPDFAEKAIYLSHDLDSKPAAPDLRRAVKILREVTLSLGPFDDGGVWDKRKGVMTRNVAMYLIRRQTSLSLRTIGDLLGVKTPTVAVGIARIEKSLASGDVRGRYRDVLDVIWKLGGPEALRI